MTTSTGASENLRTDIAETGGLATDEAPSTALPQEPLAAPEVAPAEGVRAKRFQSILDLLHDLAIAVVVCVLLITYVIQAFKVQGTSMSPELADGERILVNKFLYYFGDIQRGDVVVFWYPEDPDLSFIKRVVGLPGETVEIQSGAVYVNGRLLDESYVSGGNADQRSFPPQEIRSGHFFVLGDNRKGSNDSRSWGLVPERYIYGKAFLRIWPLGELGLVD
ncbi:MAG: signal peptidase I [Vicinamibacteria bacterium]